MRSARYVYHMHRYIAEFEALDGNVSETDDKFIGTSLFNEKHMKSYWQDISNIHTVSFKSILYSVTNRNK